MAGLAGWRVGDGGRQKEGGGWLEMAQGRGAGRVEVDGLVMMGAGEKRVGWGCAEVVVGVGWKWVGGDGNAAGGAG